MSGIERADEFETIERLFRPLAHPEWGRGLIDDVAAVPSRAGHDLIVTKDAIVEGVHFLPDDPMDLVARKLLRVNLSDLAAKGAEPFGYVLACHWSPDCGWPSREAFAQGLAQDQAAFGVHLLGGDTVATPGPRSFSATLMGWAPHRTAVARSGARPGDLLLVTGTIGDGGLGLRAARNDLSLEPERVEALAARYRLPEPRVGFAEAVRGHASAALDVSDGLLADVGHMARASAVRIRLGLERLPLSRAAVAWFEQRVDPQQSLEWLASAGDDYEIVLAASPREAEALKREAERQHLRLTQIGEVVAGEGIEVTFFGDPVTPARTGWRHG